jgi:hypothetical protein
MIRDGSAGIGLSDVMGGGYALGRLEDDASIAPPRE